MRSVIMVIAHVIGEQFVQVSFIDSDNVVEQVTAAASHPALGHTILPGTFERGPHGVYFQGSNGCRDLRPVFFIPGMNQRPRSCPKRKRLPQLLDDPTARRMLGDVDVQDTPAIVMDDKET